MASKPKSEPDRRFHIEWEQVDWNDDASLTNESAYGLYAVCGDHPAYGPNVLLYIGRSETQRFGKRLSERQHPDFINTHFSGPFTLRVGRFLSVDNLNVDKMTQDDWGSAIQESEQLMINSHSPAYNSQDVKSVLNWQEPHIHVFNWGDRGPLLPEVSSRRFSYEYWDDDKFPWVPLSEE